MLYIGHFGEKHNLPALAETLRRVHDGAGTAPVEFHVFGHAVDIIRPHLRKAGVESMLVAHDFVSQSEAYGFMRAADALILLPTANHAAGVAVGVKELEYFASGSPVICIGPLLNEMRPLVEQLPAVRQCAGPSEAARTILDELGRFVRGAPSLLRGVPNPPPLAAHTWSEKARALEDVLVRAARTTASA